MSTATRKPRPIDTVEAYKNGDGLARCKVTLESGEVIRLADLTRPELAAAARKLYPGIPGNVWLRFPTNALANIIRQGDEDEAKAKVAQFLAERAERPEQQGQHVERIILDEHAEVVDVERDTIRAKAKTEAYQEVLDKADPAKLLAAAVQAIAEASKPGVDVETVRSLVEDTVRRNLADLGVVRIEVKVPDKDALTLPDAHHALLPKVITIVGAGCNLFLVGPAGSGKSTLAHQAADALGIPFYALSLGPTTPTSKLFGYQDANGQYVRTPFREAYENGGVILLDELDNGHPGLVAEINQATANGYCAFADGMVQRHADCRIVATGNTFGRGPDRLFVGRNILDAATLDRFVTLEVDVDERLERRLARAYVSDDDSDTTISAWIAKVQHARKRALDQKLPVVVSPRATIEGAKLLACGLSEAEVTEIRLFAGIPKETRAKLA